MKKLWIVLLVIASFCGCSTTNETTNSKESCPGGQEIILKDLSGLDGCSWVLVSEDGVKYEPTNLDQYIDSPIDGKRYKAHFNKKKGGVSICMVGAIVEIDCLKEL